ncbi:hypothetical protein RF11_15910 [Thelohanellus kitauei]|uniref:Peptidase A2 domain-containing protein n=1 Tax=Thelohanellus kitauei TaxID=669202 RepID=A0A0C2ML67_THEKT|nr:hypothetical protein RF11_15910 [Thelohanellus kitauei]
MCKLGKIDLVKALPNSSYSVKTDKQTYPSFPVVNVQVEAVVKVMALVDTGACISLVVSRILGHNCLVKPSPLFLYSVTDQLMLTIGECSLKVILGRDFILQNQLVIDLPSPQLLYKKSNNETSKLGNSFDKVRSRFDLISSFNHIFASSNDDFWLITLIKRRIITHECTPFCSRPYRVPNHIQLDIQKRISTMLEKKIIQPRNSPWCAPVVVAKKKHPV